MKPLDLAARLQEIRAQRDRLVCIVCVRLQTSRVLQQINCKKKKRGREIYRLKEVMGGNSKL